MKTAPSKAKSSKASQPFDVIKEGSVSIPICAHNNIIPQRYPPTGAMLYHTLPDGKRQAFVKYQSAIYTVGYYQGAKRVRRKFSDLSKARRESELIALKLANGENEALKLSGSDRTDYVRSMQKLREWKPEIDLHLAVTNYVAPVRRLPEHINLSEVVEFYLKRHPAGLPKKTVREMVDEMVGAKESAGRPPAARRARVPSPRALPAAPAGPGRAPLGRAPLIAHSGGGAATELNRGQNNLREMKRCCESVAMAPRRRGKQSGARPSWRC